MFLLLTFANFFQFSDTKTSTMTIVPVILLLSLNIYVGTSKIYFEDQK